MTDPKTISLLDLRPRLTDILREVAADGVTFVVTRYGEPIATLSPAAGAIQGMQIKADTGEARHAVVHEIGKASVFPDTQMDPPLAASPSLRPAAQTVRMRAGVGEIRVPEEQPTIGIDITDLASTPKGSRQAQVDAILGKVNRKPKEKR